MTQTSASRMSRIWLAVRRMMPTNSATCCDISSVAKVMPKTMPRNLARSPVGILRATQFMASPLLEARRRQAQRRQREVCNVFGHAAGAVGAVLLLAGDQADDRPGHLVVEALTHDAEGDQVQLGLGNAGRQHLAQDGPEQFING